MTLLIEEVAVQKTPRNWTIIATETTNYSLPTNWYLGDFITNYKFVAGSVVFVRNKEVAMKLTEEQAKAVLLLLEMIGESDRMRDLYDPNSRIHFHINLLDGE